MFSSTRFSEEYESLKQENRDLRLQLSSLEAVGGGTFNSDEISRLRKRIKEQDILIADYRRDKELKRSVEVGSSLSREIVGDNSD